MGTTATSNKQWKEVARPRETNKRMGPPQQATKGKGGSTTNNKQGEDGQQPQAINYGSVATPIIWHCSSCSPYLVRSHSLFLPYIIYNKYIVCSTYYIRRGIRQRSKDRWTETERQTNRQADKQTDRHTDRHAAHIHKE